MKSAIADVAVYVADHMTVDIHVTSSSGADIVEHPAGCETNPLQFDHQHAAEMVAYPLLGRRVLW
jgi:hypothetical protein